MKKTLQTLIILAFVSVVTAQDSDDPWKTPTSADYPVLTQSAQTCDAFAPVAWEVMATASGDLNADGIPDCVAVMKGTDRRFIHKNEGLGSDEFDTNARILAVAFAEGDGGFRLHVQNNSFIISAGAPTLTEPFQEVTVEKGILTFLFEEFYSAGSWSMGNQKYKFRYQNNEMTLIGVDQTSVKRNTGDSVTRSYNLSTGRMTVETGHISSVGKGRLERRKFRVRPLPTLRNVKPMFTWKIEKDVII